MRRPAFILAWGLAASAVAVTLGVVVYTAGSRQRGSPVELTRTEAAAPQPPPVEAGPAESASVPSETASVQDQGPAETRVADLPTGRRRPQLDEATLRERTIKSTTEEVQFSYSLLLDDLDLTPREREDLIAVLIELRLAGTWTSYQKGRTVSQQERWQKIEAVIGEEKLVQFLVLEENVSSYWETQQIAQLMRRRGVPLEEAQRYRVFEMLVEVHQRYPYEEPPAELDQSSVEYIDHVLTQLDEFDRHVIELAPSVLSPAQVVHLFNRYQGMSRERAADIERQKKWKAENPGVDRGWGYSARWN